MRAKKPSWCHALAAASVTAQYLAAPSLAADPPYPVKPVRLVVPFPAGGPVEILARSFTPRLAEGLGQPFVYDNRPGASGTIGSEIVARAPRDGYTMLIANCAHSSNVAYYRKLPYDTLADFAPITQLTVTSGNLLAVHASLPVRSVKEFIAFARARPGQLNYASAGVGSPQHVTGALFAAMAGIKLTHVAYKGNVPALADLVGGHVELMFVSPSFALPYMQQGRLRALGLAGPRRVPALGDVPTFHEAGLAGYDYTCYHGVYFPAGTPAAIVNRVSAETIKALASPAARKFLAEAFYFPVGNSPAEFRAFLEQDVAHQAAIAKQIGLQPQ
ncbi:MAG: tripartite tricarboxylate transporter substrate binding protein [Burkholderiales bacterium]|nr:tripartite tricarboxylate transporter substrate binding protein [Burkholderiales bacterium]